MATKDSFYIRFDWAAKRLLRDKANFAILEGFLSALLGERVTILEILESESNRLNPYDKYNVVDIKARNHRGEVIIIEVQNLYEMDFVKRILYGASKAVVEQVSSGDPYGVIHKVYSIAIVYFDLGSGGDDYVFRGHTNLVGMHSHKELIVSESDRKGYITDTYDIFPEYFVLKVNNFDKIATTPLEEWMDYLKRGYISPSTQDSGLIRAQKVLDREAMTDAERYEYDRYLIAKRSQQDSMEKERAEGRAEGMAQGLSQGIAQGITQGRLQSAKMMIDGGLPRQQVIDLLHLTPDETAML
ncbi:MAG: Rpn family recombination-promoting nuclease/putative transposase [Bacteroidales bacterium]|nr:Rpn family recombination-promoting nuclease/putative transposase [Bacteroidales bacterium]